MQGSKRDTNINRLLDDGVDYSVKPDSDGRAILTLDNLTGGWHEVNATYPGDENYPNRSKSTIFFIPRAQSSISVDFASTNWVGDDVLINLRHSRFSKLKWTGMGEFN